jgi:hypothetical protein
MPMQIRGRGCAFATGMLSSFFFPFPCFFCLVERTEPFRVLRLTLRNQGIGNWLVSTLFAQISPIALGKIGWVSPPNSPALTETRANSVSRNTTSSSRRSTSL